MQIGSVSARFHCVTELQNTKTFFDKGRQFGRLLESTLTVLLAVALIFLIFNLLFFVKGANKKFKCKISNFPHGVEILLDKILPFI